MGLDINFCDAAFARPHVPFLSPCRVVFAGDTLALAFDPAARANGLLVRRPLHTWIAHENLSMALRGGTTPPLSCIFCALQAAYLALRRDAPARRAEAAGQFFS